LTDRNLLADATSPYLLQHADNPVHWRPWSDEAFAEAEQRGVPVFLSVGYAACHWCHVMAHESFEDADTAAVINADFVAVKVDREERPDVDAVYMTATQALTGQGGWPMSVFLTPDRRPFYAGTYFPPSPRHGLPSFRQILDAVSSAWRERRSEVLRSADAIHTELDRRRLDLPDHEVTDADCRDALVALQRDFDERHGGFGGAPKFPPSMVVEALLRFDDPEALPMAERTLEAMARGGIYDQLAGGFARYSVDSQWVVPHFEKMLYDNALLLGVYVHWWRRTAQARGNPLAERVVQETVSWLLEEMQSPQGGFTASLDADSLDEEGHLREGAFYAWSPQQLIEVLGPEDGAWAAEVATVTAKGTFEHGLSTLQRPTDADPERWAAVRARLREARERRARPGRDDKIVAAWNGWLIDALVQAGTVFGRSEWVSAAVEAATLLWQLHWRDGRLRRTSKDGIVGTAAGTLEDYAAVALGFTRLAAATADPQWIERAEQLAAVVLAEFDDGQGGFFDTAADAEVLYTRPQDPTDNATPSGLSTAVHALSLLAELTGNGAYADRAEAAERSAGGLVRQAPRFAGWLLASAVSRVRHAPVQVAVVGAPGDPRRAELARAAAQAAPGGSVVVAGEPDQAGIALLADRPLLRERPTAYVCRGFVCELPVTDVDALLAQLR
jgi:uncharacterized protein